MNKSASGIILGQQKMSRDIKASKTSEKVEKRRKKRKKRKKQSKEERRRHRADKVPVAVTENQTIETGLQGARVSRQFDQSMW